MNYLPLGDQSGDAWGPVTAQLVEELNPQQRFGREWSKQKQAHLFRLDQKYREWADSLVLLTATASTALPGTEKPVPPVQHFRRLGDSREARHKALERALNRRKYRAVRVYGVGDRGYLHRHTAVYVASEASESDFQPWVNSHVNNSPLARAEAHGSSNAVKVDNGIETDDSSDISSIGAYLMQNIPGCDTTGGQDHGIQSAPRSVQRGAALLDKVEAEPLSVGAVSETTGST